MQTPQNRVGLEHRRYIRLTTVFPVEFYVVSPDDKELYSEFQQAFTRDVGEGGMCLEVNNLRDDLASKLNLKSAKLRLQINMPFSAKPISAIADAAWLKKVKEEAPNKYLIGVSYEQISETERKSIVNYARLLQIKPILAAAAIVILIIAVAITGVEVRKKEALRREAVRKLALIETERSKLSASLQELKTSRGQLETKLKALEENRLELEKKLEEARLKAQAKPEEIARLEAELTSAKQKSAELNSELSKVAYGRKAMEEQLKVLEEIKASKPVKVTLAAGGVIIGKVVLESADSVKVEVPTGVITLRRDRISVMSTPSEEEIAGLARERLRLEQVAKEAERQKELESQKAVEKEKAEKIAAKKKPGKPVVFIPKKIVELGTAIKEKIKPMPIPNIPGWKLIWHDEFGGDQLDMSKWRVENAALVKNNELQYYSPQNVYVRDGKLVLKSEKKEKDGRPYTSGLVETKGKFVFQYGRVEVRAKLPGTKGMWPAHWMMPERGAWPPEIDIMELVGSFPDRIHMTNHYGVYPHNRYDTKVFKGPDYTKDFHVFALEWDADELRWYIDGPQRFSVKRNVPHEPFYIILNTAVGGTMPRNPDETTVFPQYHEIDYVRVYAKEIMDH